MLRPKELHPFKGQIEGYLEENEIIVEILESDDGNITQYAGGLSNGLTVIVRLQTHESEGKLTYWLDFEYGVGPISDEEAKGLLMEVSRTVYKCNYPYRATVLPHEGGQSLLIIQYRSETALIQKEYLIELLEAGCRLAALLRNEFSLGTMVRRMAS